MKRLIILSAVFSLPAFSQELILKEVQVKGKKETFKESLEVREVRESFAKDVGEALQRIEGISKVRKGGIANDVVIRVFQKDNINVLIDDTEVHGACPNRMDPPAFHVDFSEVERIEVVKGPFDIRHQGSLGGLVNIITRKPEMGFRLRLNANAGSFNFVNLSPTVSYRDDKFYGLAGYSYKYSKPYKDGDGRRITEYAAGHPTPPNSAYKPDKVNSRAFEINTYWAKFGFSPIKDHLFEIAYTRQEAD
ncbi:MAG: TonB-dependent receptor plug domain-containing protein, partial [Aquificaceae bacterium]|nr:TonB-dependent receptor plug domain-containing protein [Aquificaceae bacterium]